MQVLHLSFPCRALIHIDDAYNMFANFLYRLPKGNKDLKHESVGSIKFTGT